MKRTRIKICGIRTAKDALFAADLGCDALGFVFFERSPRNISIVQAKLICEQLPAFVNKVALFVNPEKDFVEEVVSKVGVDTLQFHGDESLEYCQQFNMPFIKALSINDDESSEDLLPSLDMFQKANSILLDRFDKTLVGGTGQVFDWKLIPERFKEKIILAGGLDAENVSSAIKVIHPYGVDVSSGVERAKGEKDQQLMEAFVKAVYASDFQNIGN